MAAGFEREQAREPRGRAAASQHQRGLRLSDFSIDKELARTGAGSVCKAREVSTGRPVVLKSRRTPEIGRDGNLNHEVDILKRLDHPNIVRCYGSFYHPDNRNLYIVLEYCDGGDIASLINDAKHRRRYFSEAQVWGMFLPIMRVAAYLHKKGIIHRDFKALNVFLTGKMDVKVGDFGVGRVLGPETMMVDTVYGTPLYLSPELCESRPYDQKTDIWSLGVLLYELFTLQTPFGGRNLIELSKNILAGTYRPLNNRYSKLAHLAVAALLKKEQRDRPSAEEFLNWYDDMRAREQEQKSPCKIEGNGYIARESSCGGRVEQVDGSHSRDTEPENAINTSPARLDGMKESHGRSERPRNLEEENRRMDGESVGPNRGHDADANLRASRKGSEACRVPKENDNHRDQELDDTWKPDQRNRSYRADDVSAQDREQIASRDRARNARDDAVQDRRGVSSENSNNPYADRERERGQLDHRSRDYSRKDLQYQRQRGPDHEREQDRDQSRHNRGGQPLELPVQRNREITNYEQGRDGKRSAPSGWGPDSARSAQPERDNLRPPTSQSARDAMLEQRRLLFLKKQQEGFPQDHRVINAGSDRGLNSRDGPSHRHYDEQMLSKQESRDGIDFMAVDRNLPSSASSRNGQVRKSRDVLDLRSMSDWFESSSNPATARDSQEGIFDQLGHHKQRPRALGSRPQSAHSERGRALYGESGDQWSMPPSRGSSRGDAMSDHPGRPKFHRPYIKPPAPWNHSQW